MSQYHIGQILYRIRFHNNLETKYQEVLGYVEAGTLCSDGKVRANSGMLVDFLKGSVWFTSKNDAIDALMTELEKAKDKVQEAA